jgi:hypothetical protein
MKSKLSNPSRHIHISPGFNNELRNWIFEFFLVFTAVFLGFLADRWREKIYERERERQFMISMYQDLQSDIHDFDLNIKKSREVSEAIDRMISLLSGTEKDDSVLAVYKYARFTTLHIPYYEPDQRTYEQMKYSGELRLIRDRAVADSVTGYYNSLVWILTQNNYVHERLGDFMGGAENIFDGKVLLLILENRPDPEIRKAIPKDFYLTRDRLLFNKLFVRSQYLKGACQVTVPAAEAALTKCENLRALIQKKYHLKE